MNILLSTQVSQTPQAVLKGFTKELFLDLAPPFPPVKLRRFDGSIAGDEVHIEIDFLLFKQLWISKITSDYATEKELGFVDEGTQLPFFLKSWTHRHRLAHSNGGTLIIDDISFQSPIPWLNWLLYPVLWLQFAYRKPIYRRIFM